MKITSSAALASLIAAFGFFILIYMLAENIHRAYMNAEQDDLKNNTTCKQRVWKRQKYKSLTSSCIHNCRGRIQGNCLCEVLNCLLQVTCKLKPLIHKWDKLLQTAKPVLVQTIQIQYRSVTYHQKELPQLVPWLLEMHHGSPQ